MGKIPLHGEGPTTSGNDMGEDARMLDAKIRWGCRRGMLELDLLFDRFIQTHLSQWSTAEKQQFIQLLEQSDPDLMQWCLSDGAAPEPWSALIHAIRAVRSQH